MAVDASGLLALQQLPTGSQWAWAATRPSEAELRACGLPGSEWSSPAQPQARDVPQARNLLLLLHGLGGQLSRHVRPGASVGYVQATRISLPRCVCVPDAQGGLPAGPHVLYVYCTYVLGTRTRLGRVTCVPWRARRVLRLGDLPQPPAQRGRRGGGRRGGLVYRLIRIYCGVPFRYRYCLCVCGGGHGRLTRERCVCGYLFRVCVSVNCKF